MLVFIKENLSLFIYIWFVNFCISNVKFFILYKVHSQFSKRIKSFKITIVTGLIFNIISSLVITILTASSISQNTFFSHDFSMAIIFIIFIIGEMVWLKFVFGNLPIVCIFLITVCTDTFFEIMELCIEGFPPYLFIIDNFSSYVIKALTRVTLLSIHILILYTIIFLYSRSKLSASFKLVLEYSKTCYAFGILIIFFRFMGFRLYSYARQAMGSSYNYILYESFIILLVSTILVLMYTIIVDLKRKQTELVVNQQLDYMNRLEDLQNKLRVIHHDYQNVAAGLYLEAEKGNLEEVKEYVSKRLLQLDKSIQSNIRQMNQLINIKHIELKSLLFTKTDKASRENVLFDIEVLNTIVKINMKKEDLLRCVGILIDNAIEEATITEERKVVCSLIEESGKVTILIKNSLKNEVNIGNIYRKGFSTKDEGRGIGLYSLKQITLKYKNTFLKTEVNDNWFTQTLTIF